MNQKVENLKGKLIVSCQALSNEPLHSSFIMGRMALAAKEGGAFIVGTGRSDFPNQVNNVLAFPGIFRGALDVRASEINEEMKVAAAYAIAKIIKDDELTTEFVLPDAFDPRVGKEVSAAVAKAARETGVARI